MKDTIEEMLKPLYVFMTDPMKITFEDDIVMNMKQFVRKNKAVSATQWEILMQFPKVLAKNKDSFGNLLEVINYYIKCGKEDLLTTQQAVMPVIAQMAEIALFTTKPSVLIKNTEGAILIQLMFQLMRGTTVFQPIFSSLLTRVRDRMTSKPQNSMLKKHLLGVYLSAVLQDREAALSYFESQGMTGDLVKELINHKAQMRHPYEQRLFIIGLSELLQSQMLPESLRPLLVTMITELIDMNLKLKEREDKEAYAKQRKQNQKEGDDSDDYSDEDSDDDEDDLLADDMDDDDSDEAVDGDKQIVGDGDLGF